MRIYGLVLVALLVAGCSTSDKTPTPGPDIEATIQAALAEALPGSSPVPTPNYEATVQARIEEALSNATPVSTPDIEATVQARLAKVSPTNTAFPTPAPDMTDQARPDATATTTPTPSPSPTPTPTSTRKPTVSPTPTVTARGTATPVVLEEPRILDRWPFGWTGEVVFGDGDHDGYAFVGVGSGSGILVMDVAEPAAPRPSASFPLGISGRPAYLLGSSLVVWSQEQTGEMSIYDVTVRTEPKLMSTFSIPEGQIAAYGDYIFVIAQGISIVDLSDPSDPRLANVLGDVRGGRLAIWEHYLLVAGWEEGLLVFDISDPAKPERISSTEPCPSNRGLYGTDSPITLDVAVAGDAILVADGGCGLRSIDLSQPESPLEIAHLPQSVDSVVVRDHMAVALDRRTAGDTPTTEITVIAIGDDGGLSVQGGWEASGYVEPMALVGGYFYVNYGATVVFDISDPNEPSVVSVVPTRAPEAITYDSGRLLAVGGDLTIFDVSDPADISPKSHTPLTARGHDIALEGNSALIGTHYGGLLSVDLSDYGSPRLIATPDDKSWTESVATVTENVAYSVTRDSEVFRVLSEDRVPTDISPFAVPGTPVNAVQHEDGLLFVMTQDGFWLMDTVNPETPQARAFFSTGGPPRDLAVQGHLAYAIGEFGVRVVDISDPGRPKDLEADIKQRNVVAADVSGRYLIVGSRLNHRIDVFDVIVPEEPDRIWSSDVTELIKDIVAVGDYAYILTEDGLLTLGLPTTPTARVLDTGTWGPASGELRHQPADESVVFRFAKVWWSDMVVEATFENPYAASNSPWNYGFLLRTQSRGPGFQFLARSNGQWVVNSRASPSGQLQEIAGGTLPDLKVGMGDRNHIMVITIGERGWLFVNGDLVSAVDLSSLTDAGSIAVITGAYRGDEKAGAVTRYEGFQGYSLTRRYGPAEGTMNFERQRQDLLPQQSHVSTRDLIAEAEFLTPSTDEEWYYGFAIRHLQTRPGSNRLELITFRDRARWMHQTIDFGEEKYTRLATVEVSSSLATPSQRNHLLLIAIEDAGWLFINDELMSKLDLSHNQNEGFVSTQGGFLNDYQVEVEFTEFSVWAH